MTMREAKAHEGDLWCIRRIDEVGNIFVECDSHGVHFAFARHPATVAERKLADSDAPIDETALASAPIEQLHTELY